MIDHLDGGGEPAKSMPFRRMETGKQRRFGALISLAKHLDKQRVLDFQPFFLFPVVSALGYLNEDSQDDAMDEYRVEQVCCESTRRWDSVGSDQGSVQG